VCLSLSLRTETNKREGNGRKEKDGKKDKGRGRQYTKNGIKKEVKKFFEFFFNGGILLEQTRFVLFTAPSHSPV
jgi:hypothetical protein